MSRGHCETGHNSGAIYMITFNRFLWEILQCLDYKLWGNNRFCWVVANIMPQLKRFKDTGEGIVIP